jgi:signal transduction histidine kinase
MRLLQKNTRHLLRALPLVMLACSLLFFLLLLRQTTHLQKEQLLLKLSNLSRSFDQGGLSAGKSITGEYEITQGKIERQDVYDHPVDTSIYYPDRGALIPFQMMRTDLKQHGQLYHLTAFVSSTEITHLKIAVMGGQFLIYLVLFFTIFKINQRLSVKLWTPFHETTAALDAYDLNSNEPLILPPSTGITEFDRLNTVINALNERNLSAYQSQKQFVENAAHEIQTPLAVIRSKVELLMEQDDLNEQTASLIADIGDANNRLSRLNRTLILLTKIENNQYFERTTVDLSSLLHKLINGFSRQYLENMPELRITIAGRVQLTGNAELLEVLCSNLIRNAIIHNVPGGYLRIALDGDTLVLENPGAELTIAPEQLFERFRTGDDTGKRSTGLGLALVKQIADLHNLEVTYHIKSGIHQLRVSIHSKS